MNEEAKNEDFVTEPVRFNDSGTPPDEGELRLPEGFERHLQEVRRQSRVHLGPRSASSGVIQFPSGLDFERVINLYSIQATRDRLVEARAVQVEDQHHVNGDDARQHYPQHEATTIRHVNQTSAENDEGDERPLLGLGGIDYSTFDENLNDIRRPSNVLPPPPPPKEVSYEYTMKRQGRKLFGYTGRTAVRWVLTILTGLMTGLTSIFIVSCTEVINEWRSNFLDSLWGEVGRPSLSIFVLFSATNLTLAMLSAALCLVLAPEAIGSGIPEVKAYLNGVRVKRFSSMRLFLVKIVGTILSVSSGLVVGPEGPLVHIGAIVGASCTKISSVVLGIFPNNSLYEINETLWSFVTMDLSHFSTDAERRDLVSIGAAAGFAAAFGAPIGGLLFSMEEASSYFNHTMFLKTLVATSIATFCLAVHHGDLSDYSIISMGNFQTSNENIFLNRVEELPLYVLVAIVGGVLGGLFCKVWMMLQLFRKRNTTNVRSTMIYRLCEVAIVSLLTSSMTYWIPLTEWTCRTVDVNDDLVDDDALNLERFHAHQFDCQPGEINELADIFFGSREDAISGILTDPAQFAPWTLVTVGAVFFLLMPLTLGVALPSGIFMPTVLIGSSLGGAAGMIFQEWIGPKLSPSTFALLGAAALLAGIQRSTVSLCVILVEGTGQVKVLIPVIITVVVARYVAGLIHKHGLYETAMEINRYPYLEHEDKKGYDIFPVRDIMSAPPKTLSPRERVTDLVKMLKKSNHHGFPVVDPITGKFLGLVRRDQLVALIECGVFEDAVERSSFDDDDDDESSIGDSSRGSISGYDSSDQWTPRPGIGKSPLMNLAYHIKDDRYAHMERDSRMDRLKKGISKSTMALKKGISNRTLAEDAFDTNAWLVSIRQGLASLPVTREGGMPKKNGSRSSMLFGEGALPPLTESNSSGFLNGIEASVSTEQGAGDKPECFALVGTDRKGDVIIEWLNPLYKRKYINVAGVMNQATIVVTEFCPVSKVHFLFTSLGLRHLIVLGGETGGRVVGVVTRINLLKESIEDSSGYEIEYE